MYSNDLAIFKSKIIKQIGTRLIILSFGIILNSSLIWLAVKEKLTEFSQFSAFLILSIIYFVYSSVSLILLR